MESASMGEEPRLHPSEEFDRMASLLHLKDVHSPDASERTGTDKEEAEDGDGAGEALGGCVGASRDDAGPRGIFRR